MTGPTETGQVATEFFCGLHEVRLPLEAYTAHILEHLSTCAEWIKPVWKDA